MRTTLLLRVTGWIDDSPLWVRWSLPFLLTMVVGIADLTTSADVAFTLAYLLPVALAAWHIGMLAASIVAAVSTTTSLTIDIVTQDYMPHPAILLLNLLGQFLVSGFFGLLLSHLRRHLALEHELATTDPLTGLANRRALWGNVEREVQRLRRFGSPFSLAYLDADGFKGINDRHGHRSGDEVLVAIGKTLVANVRELDCVARMGGDEFAILLPETDETGARTLIDKLRSCLEQAGWNRSHRVRFSIGGLTVADPSVDVDTVIARADALMYDVKATGKDGHRHALLSPAPAPPAEPTTPSRQ